MLRDAGSHSCVHLHASHDDTSISIEPISISAPQSPAAQSSATHNSALPILAPQSLVLPNKDLSHQSVATEQPRSSLTSTPSQSAAPASSDAGELSAQGSQLPHAGLTSQNSNTSCTSSAKDQHSSSEEDVPSEESVPGVEAGKGDRGPAAQSNEWQSACLHEPGCSPNRLWQLRDAARTQQYSEAVGHVLRTAGNEQWFVVTCCAVLCCAVLCCAVLCQRHAALG